MFPSGSKLYGKESSCVPSSALESPEPARGIQTSRRFENYKYQRVEQDVWPLHREERKLGNNAVFLKKKPKCLHLTNRSTLAYLHYDSMVCGFCAESCFLLVFTERTEREAEWDGEDGDGRRERHQQTPTQHCLYWGKHTVWLTWH